MIPKPIPIAFAVLAVLALPLPRAAAGNGSYVVADIEQDEARDAVRSGLIRPLEEVLAAARKQMKGDIIEIELDEDDGRYVYEIEYVTPQGQLMEIEIDAKTLGVVAHGPEDED